MCSERKGQEEISEQYRKVEQAKTKGTAEVLELLDGIIESKLKKKVKQKLWKLCDKLEYYVKKQYKNSDDNPKSIHKRKSKPTLTLNRRDDE